MVRKLMIKGELMIKETKQYNYLCFKILIRFKFALKKFAKNTFSSVTKSINNIVKRIKTKRIPNFLFKATKLTYIQQ